VQDFQVEQALVTSRALPPISSQPLLGESARSPATSSLLSAYVCTRACKIIADYLPALHYKFNPLEFRDIIRGIA
jgi:hypothetical protein